MPTKRGRGRRTNQILVEALENKTPEEMRLRSRVSREERREANRVNMQSAHASQGSQGAGSPGAERPYEHKFRGVHVI